MPSPPARLTSIAAVALAAAALAGCSSNATGGQGSAASTPTVVTSAPTTTAPTTTAPTTTAPTSTAPTTSTSSAAAPAAGKVVKVNKRFADTAIGESGTVLAYLRNFAVSAATKAKYSLLADDEVVLVEVKVNSSKKYYDSLGSDSFFLLGNDGQRNSENNTIVGNDMIKAGYHPLEDAENGASQTGWIAFPIDKGFTRLTLQYYTLAASTSNGKTIPAKNVNISLT